MNRESGFWRGAIDALPVQLVIVPFGVIFGAIATQAGLNLSEAMAMSILVLAGAAQIAAVQMLSDQAPVLLVIVTGLFINLRFAMYSASLEPYWRGSPLWKRALAAYLMVDQAYGLSIHRYLENKQEPQAQRIAYYFGIALPTVSFWYMGTALGALLGAAIPPQLSLEFAVPLTFIAITAPMLRGIPSVTAAVVAVTTALVCHSLPYNLGLMVAAFTGMGCGVWVENIITDGVGDE
ncbi:MAG: AzlC family ABC transporter permease [Sedimenticola sp.]